MASKTGLPLKPVFYWKTVVAAIKELSGGSPIGYSDLRTEKYREIQLVDMQDSIGGYVAN